MAAKSKKSKSNSFERLYKQIKMLKFMQIKSNEPIITQKQTSKQLDHSDSTIKRYRDDFQMDNPNNSNKYRKVKIKSKSPITQTHKTN